MVKQNVRRKEENVDVRREREAKSRKKPIKGNETDEGKGREEAKRSKGEKGIKGERRLIRGRNRN